VNNLSVSIYIAVPNEELNTWSCDCKSSAQPCCYIMPCSYVVSQCCYKYCIAAPCHIPTCLHVKEEVYWHFL